MKISGMGFHHAGLSSSDLERSLRFYTEGLGGERCEVGGRGQAVSLWWIWEAVQCWRKMPLKGDGACPLCETRGRHLPNPHESPRKRRLFHRTSGKKI